MRKFCLRCARRRERNEDAKPATLRVFDSLLPFPAALASVNESLTV